MACGVSGDDCALTLKSGATQVTAHRTGRRESRSGSVGRTGRPVSMLSPRVAGRVTFYILIFLRGINMSEPKPAAPAKPPRSPVERAIVWGVIAVGLLVVGLEANAHLAHAAALGKLQGKLEANADKFNGLTKQDVDAVVGAKTPESQKLSVMDTDITAHRVDIYSYSGLLRTRKLYVYYGIAGKVKGQEAEILKIDAQPTATAAAAMAKAPKAAPNTNPGAPPTGGMGAPPGAGGMSRVQAADVVAWVVDGVERLVVPVVVVLVAGLPLMATTPSRVKPSRRLTGTKSRRTKSLPPRPNLMRTRNQTMPSRPTPSRPIPNPTTPSLRSRNPRRNRVGTT